MSITFQGTKDSALEAILQNPPQILNEQIGLLADVLAAAEAPGTRRLILQKPVCGDAAEGAALQTAAGAGGEGRRAQPRAKQIVTWSESRTAVIAESNDKGQRGRGSTEG